MQLSITTALFCYSGDTENTDFWDVTLVATYQHYREMCCRDDDDDDGGGGRSM